MERRDANFLLGLADRRSQRGLARLNFAAGTINLTRAQPALFANEQFDTDPPRLLRDLRGGRSRYC